MKRCLIRFLFGLAITGATIGLAVASHETLAALGLLAGAVFVGLMAVGLVLVGLIPDSDVDEANGLNHPDDLEGKN